MAGSELTARQREMAKQVSLVNQCPPLEAIRTVAAADISCNRFSTTGYAGVVLLAYPKLTVLQRIPYVGPLELPYIPGLLAFREWPLLKPCLEKLDAAPDVLLCDGQGIAHPRRMGLACHVGVKTGWVTIGCGKTKLVGEYKDPGPTKGSRSDLIYEGEKVGTVLRTRDNVAPLFISPGHCIDCDHAVQLILDLCCRYRQPEPIRAAHTFVNQLRRGEVMLS